MVCNVGFRAISCHAIVLLSIISSSYQEKIRLNVVEAWSEKLGFELWNLGDLVTKRKDILKSYEKAQVLPRKGSALLEEMLKETKNMMDAKVSAIKRIMDSAENTALSDDDEEVDTNYSYYNAKDMTEAPQFGMPTVAPINPRDDPFYEEPLVQPKEIVLTDSRKFGVPINTTLSAVVPFTNVYDRAPEVIKAIKWSEALNNIFIDNYEKDPSLTWQYFGSSTGFLRQYPATRWTKGNPVDLYDGRLRSWYIEAASSPKDVMILVDSSGSMTGQRKDTAKHVVQNILETLGPNDFVNVLTFNETVNEVVPCFKDTLVQANMLNKNEFNLQLENMETRAIANFSAALVRAFEMLAQFKADGLGAQCNQAIMLVSDGVPFQFKEIFEEFNWQSKPDIPVRVFTYLVGREVADVDKIKWMACENMGYYVHLSTFAEVREDVVHFVQVLARPLVLHKDHPIVWSEIYADVVDPKLTEFEWELKERQEQKDIFKPKDNTTLFLPQDVRRWWTRKGISADPTNTKYNFMITVSMPVFDRRENATKIANLLGVVATDIFMSDLKRILMPFQLGVNGYAFLLSNNGFIIGHPDHRPTFLDILKPTYNSVDLMEVELIDDDRPIRDFNQYLHAIREAMINQTSGSKWVFVKQHYDNMRRVSRTKRLFFWTGIKDTSYTLVISYPETYGSYRVQIRNEDEIHRIHAKGNNILSFFSGNKWRVHPDWLYCKHSIKEFATPEEELIYFLKRMRQPGWKWPLIRTPAPPEAYVHNANVSNRSSTAYDKDRYYCDRSLMQELVFDAKATDWFTKNFTLSVKEERESEFKERFGVTTVFLATHSGLTRWNTLTSSNGDGAEPEFIEKENRAIDEVWYKRAVEHHFIEEESFVYAIPYKIDLSQSVLITASHAVFAVDHDKKAPVAVLGFQFQLSALEKLFKNITNSCLQDPACNHHCGSDEINCYVIDNHGYVMLSPGQDGAGKFFGEVRGDIMQRLIDDGIYKRVHIYDYQAVCFYEKGNVNFANALKSYFDNWIATLNFFASSLMKLLYVTLGFLRTTLAENLDEYYPDNYDDSAIPTLSSEENAKDKEQKFYRLLKIPKTRPQACDQVVTLYQINVDKTDKLFKEQAKECERPFVITPITGTNLYLLVLDNVCPYDDLQLTTEPVEQDYTNSTLACFKNEFNTFTRKRPFKCIKKHENESQVVLCGRSSTIAVNTLNLLLIFHLIKFFINHARTILIVM